MHICTLNMECAFLGAVYLNGCYAGEIGEKPLCLAVASDADLVISFFPFSSEVMPLTKRLRLDDPCVIVNDGTFKLFAGEDFAHVFIYPVGIGSLDRHISQHTEARQNFQNGSCYVLHDTKDVIAVADAAGRVTDMFPLIVPTKNVSSRQFKLGDDTCVAFWNDEFCAAVSVFPHVKMLGNYCDANIDFETGEFTHRVKNANATIRNGKIDGEEAEIRLLQAVKEKDARRATSCLTSSLASGLETSILLDFFGDFCLDDNAAQYIMSGAEVRLFYKVEDHVYKMRRFSFVRSGALIDNIQEL